MTNLIFDLDGTLIDSRERLYYLFQSLTPESKLTYESYWELKLDGISNEIILRDKFGFGSEAVQDFVENWMARIESPELLALDINFSGMHETLERLSGQARLHVCTARQYRKRTIEQMKRMGLAPYFSSIIVTEQRYSKEDLIKQSCDITSNDWIIGDTGKDIKAGHALGLKTCAVLSGFLGEQKLKTYSPDLILQNAKNFCL